MRLHFLVLVLAILFIVIDGQPVNKIREEEQDEDTTAGGEVDGDKDSSDEESSDEVDESPEKRSHIPKDKKASKKELKKEAAKKKIEKAEGNEISDEKAADVKNDEVHESEEENAESVDENAKKDQVESTEKKGQGSEEEKVDTKGTIAPSKDATPAKDVPIEKVADKKTVEKKLDDNAKKWWMVGDSKHWGGKGHAHWGPPHHYEHGGHTGYEGHKRHHKSHDPACCKSSDKNARKRCECAHHEGDPHDLPGYHFHERGHGGHNDHDHDLKGPWAFGYDGFGDDWNDWDHNRGNFEHLQRLEEESHHGNHDGHGDHGDCHRRDCVEEPFAPVAGGRIVAEPLGGAVVGGIGAQVIGGGPATVIGPAAGPIYGAAPAAGSILGTGPAPIVSGPVPAISLPDAGVPVLSAPVGHHLPYRVCHDCRILNNGGSRCLCKTVKHPLHHATTNYDHHVYIDCDASVHNYPFTNHLCYPRASIPTPEEETHQEGKPKQGVVYPYVGYGPWSAYPWWGDWWGGHGNHGWGGQNAGCAHPCEHEKHGCECQHHGDHQVDVDHGEALVHHNHNEHGHHSFAHNSGHEVGFSLGHHGGPNLHAYRCHDVIENKNEDPSTKAKRFCVPVGYHGGYGWPYWHGYPGVGTGLWGWGWPWIKNKVPGSKLKENSNKTSSNAGEKGKDAAKTNARRSYIEDSATMSNNTKKQTIHVGYGYASGDNYRLGYGYGGMGGVAGFSPGANAIGEGGSQNPFSRSKIAAGEESALTFTKNHIPTPEKEISVTGTKRDFDKLNNSAERRNSNI